jgi:hypothetical protein
LKTRSQTDEAQLFTRKTVGDLNLSLLSSGTGVVIGSALVGVRAGAAGERVLERQDARRRLSARTDADEQRRLAVAHAARRLAQSRVRSTRRQGRSPSLVA